MITNLARGPSSPVHKAVIMSVIIDHTDASGPVRLMQPVLSLGLDVPSASSVRQALGLISVPTGVAGAGWVRLGWPVV